VIERRRDRRQANVAVSPLSFAAPPRLVLRFAAYTAIGLALAGAAILLVLVHIERAQAERQATLQARLVADALRDRVTAQDLRAPVTVARRLVLDREVARRALGGGTLRVDVLDATGRVTYSSNRSLIGTSDSRPGLVDTALTGTTTSTVLDEADGHVLRAYAPLSTTGATGVFVLTRDYAPIAAAAEHAVIPIVVVLDLVLLGLWIALFPLLKRVTNRLKRQMDALRHQALHDGLSGLPNRTHFHAALEGALAQGQSSGLAVMMLDLDRFKEVNDTLGHGSGDLLLVEIGRRLRHVVREGDMVARLGGDEFGVLSVSMFDASAATGLANRLRQAIAEPFEVAGVSLEVQVSVGIVIAPDDGQDVETLLRRADVAMYAAKRAHAPQLYAPELDDNSPLRLALVGELRHALETRELTVYYQPQLEFGSGEISGVEALVRWQHPTRGFLAPDEFLPTAEHAGLIRDLTRYVLHETLRQCRVWQNKGRRLEVAINVSDRDLVDTRFPDEVRAALGEHGIDPACLQLEITEGTILADGARSAVVLERLDALGVRIAIDDFGIGYSSLAHLRRLPVDVLKIDRGFVMGMQTERADAVIVDSTIALAHSLGLQVIAEGVEDEATLQRLAAAGCDTAQGYHLSRPLPPGDLEAWLDNRAEPEVRSEPETVRHLPVRIAPVGRIASG
jgi:diguanylate cyclase (GGDEF)-like protein